MERDVKVLMHLDACGKFAFHVLQNHTVKILENQYSYSLGDCERESTE